MLNFLCGLFRQKSRQLGGEIAQLAISLKKTSVVISFSCELSPLTTYGHGGFLYLLDVM